MPSLYLLHAVSQLPSDTSSVNEGTIFPLLRRVNGTTDKLNWAYAVPKPNSTADTKAKRKNRLTCSVLRALGFVLDENNASATGLYGKYDFFSLPDTATNPLIVQIDKSVFNPQPDLSGTGATLEVMAPDGGHLKLATSGTVEYLINVNAPFGVDQFKFKSGGKFILGSLGQNTTPHCEEIHCALKDSFLDSTPAQFNFDLKIEQTGTTVGSLACNSGVIKPNNDDEITVLPGNEEITVLPGNEKVKITNDSRHDRLTLDVVTLVCLTPTEATEPHKDNGLAIEVFPAVTFQPNEKLPISVSVGHQGLALRLPPVGSAEGIKLRLNRIRPCLRVTIRGPLIHAEASSSGALEALRFLEPAERKLGETVEQINDFMTYSFEICMPIPNINGLTLPQLEALEGFTFPRPTLKDIVWLKDLLENFEGFELKGLFDFQFPNLGIPALNEYELTLEVDGDFFKVELPNGLDLPDKAFWKVRLKRPSGVLVPLELTDISLSGRFLKFKIVNLPSPLPNINLDRLVLKWAFKCEPPTNLALREIELNAVLPTVRLPIIDGKFDLRFLKLRVIKADVDLGTFGVLDLSSDFKTVTLDIPEINGTFPALKVFHIPDISLEFSLDLSLSLAKCFLSDLLGDLPSVDFRLSIPRLTKFPDFDAFNPNADFGKLVARFSISEIVAAFGNLSTPIIPFELAVRIPNPKLPKVRWDELRLLIGFRFDLSELQLADNRIYFFLPQLRGANGDNAPRQALECDIFTLTFPNRPDPLGFPTADNHDGYFDLNAHTFVIELKYREGETPEPPPKIKAYFPGGMDPRAARLGREEIENLADDVVIEDKSQAKLPNITGLQLKREYAKRFELEFDTIDPKFWPNAGPDLLSFRLSPKGLTLAANLGKTEVQVDDSGFGSDGTADSSNNGLIKPFKFQPQDKLRELKSRIVIIDNELKEAGVYAKTEVPGVDGLMAEVSVALRQTKKGALPEVIASLELERSDEAPLAELSIKLLELSLERIQLGLIWRPAEKEWDYSIIADGTIAFTGAAALVPDLEDLRAPSIQVIGLDLRRLNLRELRVPINLVKPVRFEILDGLFGVELGDLEIGWVFENGIPKPQLLACELAKLEFKNPGALEVAITVGGLNIEFDTDLSAHVKLPSSLGIEVALGPTARFAGRVGWVENDVERFLFASGKVSIQGFPEIQGLLKFGTGLKNSGRREINLVLFGEMEGLDEQLFAGVVVKSLGLGVGLNNRLSVIPPRPSADQIIARIDQLTPGELEGWQFVREGGFYLSVVGAVTLASNVGGPDVLNAYVVRLVASIDTNFDLVAAGKLWLSCTVDGAKNHPNNPAFVGALVLSPSQRKLEIVLESRKNAFVEQNDLIKKLLDKGNVRFAFRMTPELVDFHLAEFSYTDQMFGVQMEFRGEYRFAIFKRAVLLKSELSATGSISRSLSAGPGGFDMDGEAHLRVGYGGLLSDHGIMAYAFIDAGIRFRVSAWIEIGFSISFKICGKRFSKSWTIVFRLRVPEMELTFRGNIAAADHGGLIGVDVQVGINVVICGYRLRASGRLAVNPELYQEVRATVAAFEEELNQAVKKLESPPSLTVSSIQNTAAAFSLTDLSSNSVVKESLSTSKDQSVENWLLYTRTMDQTTSAVMLLPTGDTTWLTPTIASVDKLTLTKVGDVVIASFDVHAKTHPQVVSNRVRLLGLRGDNVPTQLNGTWPVFSRVSRDEEQTYTIALDVTSSNVPVRSEPFELFGGIWFVEESVAGLQPDDHSTVPYLNDVERVVLPLINSTAWKNVEAFDPDSRILTANHGLTGNARIVMRRSDQASHEIHDRGTTRRFDGTDISVVTFFAEFRTSTTLFLRDFDKVNEAGDATPKSDWKFAPAIEIAPTWNARNRLAALRSGQISAEQYRSYAGAAAGWAETANKDDSPVTNPRSTAGYGVVFDERFASADPRYAVPERHSFPGVLSPRFRPLDEVAIVGADVVLTAAKEYELAAAAVVRQEMHGALDLLDDESQMQSQAQATNLLVHRFSDPAGIRDDDHPEAPFSNEFTNDRANIVYGWFFSALNDDIKHIIDKKEMFVRRSGSSETKVTDLRIPNPNTAVKPETLPIRQEFIVDQSNPNGEQGRVSIKLPIRIPSDALKSNPEEVGRFQIYRRIGNGPEVLIGDHLRPDISYLHDSEMIVQRAILFSDDFQVVNREFVDRDLQSLKSAGSFPTVNYRLHVLSENDPGGPKASGGDDSISWADSVPLFIPPVVEFPRNLAIAVSVGSLINGSDFVFQLVDMSGEFPVLAQRDHRPLRAEKEFELGLDDENLKQTGFYAGESNEELSRRDPDGSKLTLDRVRLNEDIESEIGKVIVGIKNVPSDLERYTVTNKNVLTIGKSYRLFLRPTSDTAVKSLHRATILLVRELPKFWDETVRYQTKETLELIPEPHVQEVLTASAEPVLVDFSADDLYAAGRSAIRAVWPSSTLMEGGIEMQFRDFDDSSMRSRALIEVVEADRYSISQQDFRNEDFWTPRPSDRLEQYASRVMTGEVITPTLDSFNNVFLMKSDRGNVDRIEWLEDAKEKLALLGPSPNWQVVANVVRDVQAPLLAFEKSPLNLNSLKTRRMIESIRHGLRSLIVGNRVDLILQPTDADIQKARQANQSLLALLTRIEQTRPETISNAEAEATAFLDRDTSRKLAGIVRRRLAIADELLGLSGIDETPAFKSLTDVPMLARQEAWTRIRDDAESLISTLPVTQELTSIVNSDQWAKQKNSIVAGLGKLIEEIKSLPLSQFVPRAAGLTKLLKTLEEKVERGNKNTLAAILKRPHHELTTTKNEAGEIIAKPVPLRTFLPPDVRRTKPGELPPLPDERLERLGLRVGQLATLDDQGNIAIWTTRGNSVQTAPMRRIQNFQVENGARRIALAEIANGPLLLVGFDTKVELWDAATAMRLRSLPSDASGVFAQTTRGLELLTLQNNIVKLSSIESPTRAPQEFKILDGENPAPISGPITYHGEAQILAATSTVRHRLTVDSFARLTAANVPDDVINKLNAVSVKDKAFTNIDHFKAELANLLTAAEITDHQPTILANAVGQDLISWRDLGRPENKTPLSFTEFNPSVSKMDWITLPTGPQFIVATPTKVYRVDAVTGFKEEVGRSGDVIKELVVDRRELNGIVRVGDGGKLKRFGLLGDDGLEDSTVSTGGGLAILHGRHEGEDNSYVALSNAKVVFVHDNDENIDIEIQVLPQPSELGASSGKIIGLTSALQTARSARAATDIMNLFHLWERLGFALDFAAQDNTTRLMSFNELRVLIHEAITALPRDDKPIIQRTVINGESHYVYVIEGEEPDAEFRNEDRVGFSHAKVAVVPESFLRACLGSSAIALQKWLTHRSIDVNSNEQARLIEFAHITYLTRLVGVPTGDRLGVPTESFDSNEMFEIGKIHVQPRTERFVQVPASAGFSHWTWTLPDRKGHRMMVAARRVSRYEPLLRWWLNLHTRFDLPEEQSLNGVADLQIISLQTDHVRVNRRIPSATGWQPLRLELTSGTGVGQRRELAKIEGDKLSIDPGDPWLTNPLPNQTMCRVIDAAPGWRMVVLDPIHDPVVGDGPQSLMVYQYPHSRWPRFSYQIPLDGMRSTYNQISRVRTGYHGVELAFRYFLPDHIDNSEAASLDELLNAIILTEDTGVPLPARTTKNLPIGPELQVRLFRHERMVNLPELPFFYRYRLDVRSAYKSRLLEYDRTTASDLLPEDENLSPPAQRLPACLGMNTMQLRPLAIAGILPEDQPGENNKVRLFASGADPFEVSKLILRVRPTDEVDWIEKEVKEWIDGVVIVDDNYADKPQPEWKYELLPEGGYEATLFVSANRDHLTREETTSEPEPIRSAVPPGSENQVCARDLPDFKMEYSLNALTISGSPPIASQSDIFILAGSIQMPWSPNFKVPNGFVKDQPFVWLATGLKIGRSNGAGEIEIGEREMSVQLERVKINNTDYWRLRFWIINERGQSIVDDKKLFVEGQRDGRKTRAVRAVRV